MLTIMRAAVLLSMAIITNAQTTTCTGQTCTCSVGKFVFTSTTKIYEDCTDHFTASATTGIYTINPGNVPGGSFDVYCDFDTTGGPWTVFQRRTAAGASINWKRNWAAFRDGFWGTDNNHYLGNAKVRRLTQLGTTEMRIDVTIGWRQYSRFEVGSESDNFRLYVAGSTGSIWDALNYHNGRQFSTYDRDNDVWGNNCANWPSWGGAWWYGACWHSNLNGWTGYPYDKYFAGINPRSQMALKVDRTPSEWLTVCEPCAAGRHQNQNLFTGTTCTDCAVGKFMASVQGTTCNNCYAGQIQPGNLLLHFYLCFVVRLSAFWTLNIRISKSWVNLLHTETVLPRNHLVFDGQINDTLSVLLGGVRSWEEETAQAVIVNDFWVTEVELIFCWS